MESEPSITIQLGIAPDSHPTLRELLDRCNSRLQLAASGQEVLDYLRSQDVLSLARIFVRDNDFHVELSIPTPPQLPLTGVPRRGQRRHDDPLARQDEAQQVAVEETRAAVTKSARLVDRVADKMSTSMNLAGDLRHIEENEGVTTEPARRYIYSRQPEFKADVDGELIGFKPHVVRSAVAEPGQKSLKISLEYPERRNVVVRGKVLDAPRDGKSSALAIGKIQPFRLVQPQPWQLVLLASAAWIRSTINLTATPTSSTCTLRDKAADVHGVQNWLELAAQTIEALIELMKLLDESDAALASDSSNHSRPDA